MYHSLSYTHSLSLSLSKVRRVFVNCNMSSCLCKLIVGEPVTFLDLLHSDQSMFQDLLRLMMMHPESVANLNLSMPGTTTEGGDQVCLCMMFLIAFVFIPTCLFTYASLFLHPAKIDLSGDVNSSRNSARDGIHWPGRGASVGDIVTADNRQEYLFRKLEHQVFGRTKAEVFLVMFF
jgi:hypothetical protein